uniref:Uncharacterized protein n=1 Tax=Tanacetum cinerariifolium TaxID=118510 RepID=A0A6L2M5B6_TANCI|nr:hypothetical protein [Tanacetum cinerariifolium]
MLDSSVSVCDGWRVKSLEVRKLWAAAVAEAAVEIRPSRLWRRVEGWGGGFLWVVPAIGWDAMMMEMKSVKG